MKESRFCKVLMFLADTPKSAAKSSNIRCRRKTERPF